ISFFHPVNSWRLAVVLRADVQGLDGAAFGDEVRSRRHAIEGCLWPVVDVVVDEEQIAPGAGGDIAARAVDGVAVEQHYAPGRPCRLLYAVALDQPGQPVLVRYAELLTAPGLLRVVLGALPDAADEVPVRPANQEQRRVPGMVVGQQDGAAGGTHARQPVLGVPGLEVGVPVELLALEARFEVEAGLVHIDIAIQQVAYQYGGALISGGPSEQRVVPVDGEYRAQGTTVRLADGGGGFEHLRVLAHALEFGLEHGDLLGTEQVLDDQEAVALEARQLLLGQG